MARPADEDGTSLRTVMERRLERGSRDPRAQASLEEAERLLREPSFPEPLRYLWEWFNELSAGRGAGMAGMMPISWESIDAWARLTGQEPNPRECRALMAIDAVIRFPGDDDG